MARIRTIKPTFFTSLTIADLTPEQRLTFIGLWTHVDDEGRCIYDPRLIKAAIWPLDDRSAADVAKDVQTLTEHSLMTHYVVGERSYLEVSGWAEHQRINRKVESKLPGSSEGQIRPLTSTNEVSVRTHGALTEDSLQEGKGKEGKGSSEAKASGRTRPQPTEVEDPTAQTVLGAWIDHQNRRPAGSVIGQVGKHIKTLLAENFTPEQITAGLEQMDAKQLHPSTLPSLVSAAANVRSLRSAPNPNRHTFADGTLMPWDR